MEGVVRVICNSQIWPNFPQLSNGILEEQTYLLSTVPIIGISLSFQIFATALLSLVMIKKRYEYKR